MSCCGGKRQPVVPQSGVTSGGARGIVRTPPAGSPRVVFEYSGANALAVTGRVSGTRYVFRTVGARVEVDPRDRRSLTGVPGLREVS